MEQKRERDRDAEQRAILSGGCTAPGCYATAHDMAFLPLGSLLLARVPLGGLEGAQARVLH